MIRLFEEVAKNIENTFEYIESLDKQTKYDRENLDTHRANYKKSVMQEQEQNVRLKDNAQKEKERIEKYKKKLSIGIDRNPKKDPIYYKCLQDDLIKRVEDAKEELRFLKESRPRGVTLEDTKQERKDRIDMDNYVKYMQMKIEVVTNNDNEVRFIFYAINRADLKAPYTVGLHISDKNEYKVTECSPHVEEMHQLSEELNENRELYHFIKQARQAFVNSIDQQ